MSMESFARDSEDKNESMPLFVAHLKSAPYGTTEWFLCNSKEDLRIRIEKDLTITRRAFVVWTSQPHRLHPILFYIDDNTFVVYKKNHVSKYSIFRQIQESFIVELSLPPNGIIFKSIWSKVGPDMLFPGINVRVKFGEMKLLPGMYGTWRTENDREEQKTIQIRTENVEWLGSGSKPQILSRPTSTCLVLFSLLKRLQYSFMSLEGEDSSSKIREIRLDDEGVIEEYLWIRVELVSRT